ncbi:MAG TPA: photosynthetic reaction center cytochrome c subunit family protein [Gemmatimonadaceae bacterium]|nr:photosynthetic reaction center cytochrome c subunit family protein [Gemmatimonadaceae bacterium]
MNRLALALSAAVLSAASCSRATPPAATPAPTTPAPTSPAPTAAPTGGVPGAGGRAQLTPEQRAARRDSLSAVRADAVRQVLATIAGRENEPAGQVFTNVQLLKDMPARQFVVAMDSTFGRALSFGCASCHVAGDWAAETRPNKGRTRIMIEMVNAINSQHLSKMPAGRSGNTPRITCITCHRGNGNPGSAILP